MKYAAAVLKGEPQMLELFAPCFVSNEARIKKHEDVWILESSEFASCTTGEQVSQIVDNIVSRINRILSLYCGLRSGLSVERIHWINEEGQSMHSMRTSISLNVVSSEGLAELKTMSGCMPLGSTVFQASFDAAVNEALALCGESGLGWPQVYDIIEFLGGVAGIVRAGYADRKKTNSVRQTANYYRHLGSQKNYPLPLKPPTLLEAGEFAGNLLKRWISSRLPSPQKNLI
jgi:hypothetical protein